MRAPLLVLALLGGACAGPARTQAPRLPVEVTRLSVDFPSRDRGRLEFTLQLPPGRSARSVSWELSVEGVRFATGVELLTGEGPLVIRTPLVSRHLNWREGLTSFEVGLKGEVDVGAERLAFRVRRDVEAHGQPLWFGGD